MRDNSIYGECARHPGNNMVDCSECELETNMKTLDIDPEKLEVACQAWRKMETKSIVEFHYGTEL